MSIVLIDMWKYAIIDAKRCLLINRIMKANLLLSLLILVLVACVASAEQGKPDEAARAYDAGLQALHSRRES